MIILNVCNGLGNQMFEYAFARALALKNNDKLYISLDNFDGTGGNREYGLSKFVLGNDVDFVENHKLLHSIYNAYINGSSSKLMYFILSFLERFLKIFNVYSEKDVRQLKKIPYYRHKINIYTGIFQSEEYFSEYKEKIIDDFKLKDIRNDVKEYGEIINKDAESVCLHVRRGDYLYYSGFDVCSVSYYYSAIDLIKKKLPNATIYLFSDDIEWSKKQFPEVSVINIKTDMYEDLYLMSKCNNFIMSNSTFSWWAQYLSDNKIVIAPNYWLEGQETVNDCIYNPAWILLDC